MRLSPTDPDPRHPFWFDSTESLEWDYSLKRKYKKL